MSQETLNELNEAIELTEKAAKRINAILKAENKALINLCYRARF